MQKKEQGFTLIELMVTISIFAVLAILAVPSFNTLLAKQKFNQTVHEYRQTLLNARSQAILTKNSVAVCTNKTSNKNDIDQDECIDLIFPGINAAKKLKLKENNRVYIMHVPEKISILSIDNDMSVLFTSTGAVLKTESSSPVSRTISFCSSSIKADIVISLLGSITNTKGTC